MLQFSFETVNEALPELCDAVMNTGTVVSSRLGEKTKELRNVSVALTNPRAREVYVPGRRASYPAQIIETMWVLSGRNDVAALLPYLPRAADYSDNGKTWRGAYGPRLRAWGLHRSDAVIDDIETMWGRFDQLAAVLNLLKNDPGTRRAVLSIYDPAWDIKGNKDIPCNDFLQFMSRDGYLDLTVTVRSNDLIWGWSGINQFEWSFIQEIMANSLGMEVGSLTFNIGSLHVYDRHWDRAMQLAKYAGDVWARRETMLPQPEIIPTHLTLSGFDRLSSHFWALEHELRTSDVDRDVFWIQFGPTKDPLLDEWLKVLYRVHRDPDREVDVKMAYRQMLALNLSPGHSPKTEPTQKWDPQRDEFVAYVNGLHERKHQAYGDSWKRRGELIGILANIARKVDRLGISDDVETDADTAIDLLVYLLKYQGWLHMERGDGSAGVEHDGPAEVHKALVAQMGKANLNGGYPRDDRVVARIRNLFGTLEKLALATDENLPTRQVVVRDLLASALPYAYKKWSES